jgi:hypothetical protein
MILTVNRDNISYEKDVDISTKILNYNRAMGTINLIFKPSLVQEHTRIKVCKTLSRLILTYGSEAWKICKSDKTTITANKMKLLRTAGYKNYIKRETRRFFGN